MGYKSRSGMLQMNNKMELKFEEDNRQADERMTDELQTLSEIMYFVLVLLCISFMFYTRTKNEYSTCYCIGLYKLFPAGKH